MVESSLVTLPSRAASSRAEPKPPVGVIESLATGFETVASHLGLLLFPALLDLFLWLGPQLSIDNLIQRLAAVLKAIPQTGASGFQTQDDLIRLFGALSSRTNIFSLFSTAPVGVPSLKVEQYLTDLMNSQPPRVFINGQWRVFASLLSGQVSGQMFTEWQLFIVLMALILLLYSLIALGIPGVTLERLPVIGLSGNTVFLNNEFLFLVLSLSFTLFGFFLAAMYFSAVGSTLLDSKPSRFETMKRTLINWAKFTAFSALLKFAAVFLSVPFFLVLALLQFVSPILAGLLLSLWLTSIFWVMFYLAFAVHGMVLQNRGVIGAIWDSVRMVHWNTGPTLGLFLIITMLNWGLGFLWSLPSSNSWLMLAGIGGHAFVSTALVAATFAFYKDRYRWWIEMRQWLMAQKKK